MTVASAAAKAGPYTGNDATSSFAFSFKVFADTDIRVVETVIATEVETDIVLNTNYTVSRNVDQDNNPGGTITYKVGGVTTALPSAKKLTIIGDFDYEQPTDIPSGGSFSAQVLENALDRVTMLLKQLKEAVDRSIKFGPSSSANPDDYITYVEATINAVAESEASAAAAAASEAAALAAETNAETAEVNAEAAQASAEAALTSLTSALAALEPTFNQFSGDGSTVNFTLSVTPSSEDVIDVYISGVYQQKAQYSVVGTTLTFVVAPTAGSSNIEVKIAPNTAFVAPGSEDWGLITAAASATGDYGALV